MFIRSMEQDYQVLSVLAQSEGYTGCYCRKMKEDNQTGSECYLHGFRLDKTDEVTRTFLMQLSSGREPVDLKDAFIYEGTLYLEFAQYTGPGLSEALKDLGKADSFSLKKFLTGKTEPDAALPERIALAKHLMEACLSKRLPAGILWEALSEDNLIVTDTQFSFRYEFHAPEKLADNRIKDVCALLAGYHRRIFGNNLRCNAGNALGDWIRWLENPDSEIRSLADIYPGFLDAVDILEQAEKEDLIVIDPFRKKLESMTRVISHILSPVPICEQDYVVIGNYHVFGKLLLLVGAAAVVVIIKCATGGLL